MYAKYFYDNAMVRHTVTVTIVTDYLDGKDDIGLDPTTNLSSDEHDDKVNNTVFCTVMLCTWERTRRFGET
jgi:hypothetical protein